MAALWSIFIGAGAILAAALGLIGWYNWMTRNRRKSEAGYEYIMVIDDSSAREVTLNERKYLETEFDPANSARPYIKFRYESVDSSGSLEGFLLRRQLPSHITIRKTTEHEEEQYGG